MRAPRKDLLLAFLFFFPQAASTGLVGVGKGRKEGVMFLTAFFTSFSGLRFIRLRRCKV